VLVGAIPNESDVVEGKKKTHLPVIPEDDDYSGVQVLEHYGDYFIAQAWNRIWVPMNFIGRIDDVSPLKAIGMKSKKNKHLAMTR
jgi:hypothetical protein